MLKNFLKTLLFITFLLTVGFVVPVKAAQSAIFIMYHRFGDPRHPSTNTPVVQFKQQLHWLQQHGYHVLPVPLIVNRLQHHQPLPNKTVGILIDDAYRSVYQFAWPLLRQYHDPFTLFIATQPIDRHYPDLMSWQQIRQLAQAHVTIGNHTVSHPHLTRIRRQHMIKELQHAQHRFQKELGQTPPLFAYPYGEYSPAVRRWVKHAGFKAAFTQTSGVASYHSDFFALPRFALNEHYGKLSRFQLIMHTLPLQIRDLRPHMPLGLHHNPPTIRFFITSPTQALRKLNCYVSQQGKVPIHVVGRQVTMTPRHAFPKGRTKINCTLPTHSGYWYWLGLVYYWVASPQAHRA